MNKKSLIVVLFTVAFVGIFSNCGTNKATKEAIKVWENYVRAVESGQKEIANSFVTKESQEYSDTSWQFRGDYSDTKFSVIKAEDKKEFVKLQILAEKGGKQIALFEYLVRQNKKYLLQYPFLIFAKDWPTKETQHFIIHSQSFSDGFLGGAKSDSEALDPAILESFYSKITNLIDANYSKRIHYYLCQDKEQAEQLAGLKGVLWTSIGSAIISTNKYDFAEITGIVARTKDRPIDLLYHGIRGYAELERTQYGSKKYPTKYKENSNFTTAKFVEKLGMHPILSLLESQNVSGQTQRQEYVQMFVVGGAFVSYLVEKYGGDKFRMLYENSPTNEEFEKQIKSIYKTNLQSLEKQLINKYKRYFQEGRKDKIIRR